MNFNALMVTMQADDPLMLVNQCKSILTFLKRGGGTFR